MQETVMYNECDMMRYAAYHWRSLTKARARPRRSLWAVRHCNWLLLLGYLGSQFSPATLFYRTGHLAGVNVGVYDSIRRLISGKRGRARGKAVCPPLRFLDCFFGV